MLDLRLPAILVLLAGMTAAGTAADFAGGQSGGAAAGSSAASVEELRAPHGFGRAKAIDLPALDASQSEGTPRALVPAIAFAAVGRSRDDRGLSVPPSSDLLALVGNAPDSTASERVVPTAGDDRTQVTDTTRPPYRTIGYVEAIGDDGNYTRCTGFLVAPRTVLTPAHCLYDRDAARWRRDFVFAPGLQDEKTLPFGYTEYEEAYVLQGFIENSGGEYASVIGWDVGVIILRDPIGEGLGWMACGARQVTEAAARLAGYPADKPFGTMWEETCTESPNPAWPDFIEHDCAISAGINGGPLFVRDGERWRAVGMQLARSTKAAIAIRLTPALVGWISGVAR